MNFEKFWSDAQKLGVLGYMVSQNDDLLEKQLAERELRRNVYSVSKSFTAMAVGLAVEEGLLSLEEKLTDVFREDLPETVSGNLKKATVRDLLTMCLGHAEAHLMGAQRLNYTDENWIRLALAVPLEYAPGERFVYSNVGPYLAAVLVQRRAGCSLIDYLMPRLFTPMGIWRPSWETDPQNRSFGASGLMLSLSELHKFGHLWLHNGCWEGKQLIPEWWMHECARPQSAPGYGYLFWRGEQNSFRAEGFLGQFVIMVPEKNAVITTVSECRDLPALKQLIYTEIFPQL